jgi:hypothetical protein
MFMVEEPGCCPEANMTICDDGCQAYLTDDNNCGGCGIECAFDEFCDGGACTDICPGAGQELCDDTCEDTLNDDSNCGGCGVTCAFDEFCDNGACADVCPGVGQELCDDTCVDTLNDDSNCGDCGVTCAFDEFCGGGTCGPICPGAGQAYCNDVCVDTLNDDGNCGGCGVTCAFDEFCGGGTCADICPGTGQEYICPGAGQEYCDGSCVDTFNDLTNCGGCGVTCAFDEFCGSGTCQPVCPGQALCGADCTDLQTDPSNCGYCGNVCDPNSICTGGECVECRNPTGTNCNNECVNIHKDPFNCGACGNACDFSGCPSGGTGACSMGTSCICEEDLVADGGVFGFSPVWTETEAPEFSVPALNLPLRTVGKRTPVERPNPAPPAPPAVDLGRPAASLGSAKTPLTAQDVRQRIERSAGARDSVRALSGVVEAPVCGINPVAQEILDGESFTLCQTGAVVGREIFTEATVMKDGKTVGRGPCALIVPAPEVIVGAFEPSAVSLTLADESGDGLLQPGETAEAWIEILNLGTGDMLNPVATLSSPPDQFNPLAVTVVSDTSMYGDFPALDNPADCGTAPQLEPRTNVDGFVLTIPPGQESDIGRVFKVTLQGDVGGSPMTVDMPIVIGIGGVCDPAAPDGERYDGLEGFLSPIDVKLVPTSYPANTAPGTVNQGSNVPLKLRLTCGGQTLDPDDIELTPQIVRIVHDTLGDLSLANIKDSNSNPDDPFFDCGTSRCEFGLRTSGFPVGTITVSVRMPDSRIFHASVTLVP